MDGNPDSNLLFIGEGPGFHEDKIGKPFVGAAGKLLDQMLGEVDLDRTKCAIANVVKCRPPGNRNPEQDEIDACKPYLQAQIDFMNPAVIVTLGNFATRFVLGQSVSISKVRGNRYEAFGSKVIPTFHPAAALHGGGATSPVAASIRADLAQVAAILAEEPPRMASVAAEQATLF